MVKRNKKDRKNLKLFDFIGYKTRGHTKSKKHYKLRGYIDDSFIDYLRNLFMKEKK